MYNLDVFITNLAKLIFFYMIISFLILGYRSWLSVTIIYYAFIPCSFRNKSRWYFLHDAPANLNRVCISMRVTSHTVKCTVVF